MLGKPHIWMLSACLCHSGNPSLLRGRFAADNSGPVLIHAEQTDDKREHWGEKPEVTRNQAEVIIWKGGELRLKRGRIKGAQCWHNPDQPSMVMTSRGGGSHNLEAGSEIAAIFSDTGGGLCEIRDIFWTPEADFGRLAKTRQIISLSCATVWGGKGRGRWWQKEPGFILLCAISPLFLCAISGLLLCAISSLLLCAIFPLFLYAISGKTRPLNF